MAYSVRTDLNAVFGKANVDTWADLDGDQDADKITARIAAAVLSADGEIDAFMLHGPYALPIVDAENATPVIVRDVSAKLAGVWLYEARGVMDADDNGKPFHRLASHVEKAWAVLHKLKDGRFKINVTTPKRNVPEVIKELSS